MFSARYSSGSSGFAPAYSPSPAISFAWCSSKLSEMYLRKIRPRTTCAVARRASTLPRELAGGEPALRLETDIRGAAYTSIYLVVFCARAILRGATIAETFSAR